MARIFDPLAVELAMRGGAPHPDATPARVLHALGHESALPVCELEPGAAAQAVRAYVATSDGIPLVAGEDDVAAAVSDGLRDRGVDAALVRVGARPAPRELPEGPIHVHVDATDGWDADRVAAELRALLAGRELVAVSVSALLEDDGSVSPELARGMAPILDA